MLDLFFTMAMNVMVVVDQKAMCLDVSGPCHFAPVALSITQLLKKTLFHIYPLFKQAWEKKKRKGRGIHLSTFTGSCRCLKHTSSWSSSSKTLCFAILFSPSHTTHTYRDTHTHTPLLAAATVPFTPFLALTKSTHARRSSKQH